MPVSTQFRPQPPSIKDPRRSKLQLEELGVEAGEQEPPHGADESGDEDRDQRIDWLRRARDAFSFSTSFVDSNYRQLWNDSIRAFNSEHPGASKYNSELFRKRSRIFRPKTRAIIRKNEAAAAAAFFTNPDYTSVEALNQSKPEQRASADVQKELLQYRLSTSIPWYMILLGGLQDAQAQGVAIAHVYWKYKTRGEKVIEDKPCIDLIPIENFRFDPAASWTDPCGTSPYVIHLIPMYVCDVKARMKGPNAKGQTWKSYDDAEISACMDDRDDSTRTARSGNTQDPTKEPRPLSEYDIVWVHRHIHRHEDEDYEFYTLASMKMLTDPEPLEKSVFHGKRPYVVGCCIITTHKPYADSVPQISKGLQEETNEIANQRLDNLKLVMNKRWFVKRGRNVDMGSLVRNVPGSVTLADNLEEDIKAVEWNDVTASAYMEQDRINTDLDELLGNFSPASVQQTRAPRTTDRSLTLLQGPANLLTEYLLSTYTQTFLLPVLRQLILLEQFYETDERVFEIVGEKAKLAQRFGQNQITDDMLAHECTIRVNVGMGATDPITKLMRFLQGVMAYANIARLNPPGMNLEEIAREIFGLTGYQDGVRFFTGQDPDKAKAQQMVMQMAQTIGQKLKDKEGDRQVKLATSRDNNQTKEQIAYRKNLADIIRSLIAEDSDKRQLLANLMHQLNNPEPQAAGTSND